MSWLKNSHPIVLVFQDDSIRYVKMKSRSPLVIHKVKEKLITPGIIEAGKIENKNALSQLIAKCVKEWRIKGKKVRFAIPDATTVIRKIPVPSIIPESELSGYVNVELGASIHIPFDEPVFDLHRLSESGENTDYLLFAAPEAVMKEYVEVLEAAKLRPIDAELSSLSTYRLFHTLDLVDQSSHYLMLNLERNGINATAFYQHTPVFTRFISLDSGKSDSFVTGHAHFNIEGRWSEIRTEIERILNFYQFSLSDGKEMNCLMLTGDHPEIQQIITRLDEAFRLDLVTVPNDQLKLNRGLDIPTKFHTTIGLGLKGE